MELKLDFAHCGTVDMELLNWNGSHGHAAHVKLSKHVSTILCGIYILKTISKWYLQDKIDTLKHHVDI